MNGQHKRRVDIVLADEFTEGISFLEWDILRDRRDMVEQVETELSHYRRLLHGRQDLLDFEMKRRSGEESRSHLPSLDDKGLTDVEAKLKDAEQGVTAQRNGVHAVHEVLQAEVTSRYQTDVASE
jgi:hypothetical protein